MRGWAVGNGRIYQNDEESVLKFGQIGQQFALASVDDCRKYCKYMH